MTNIAHAIEIAARVHRDQVDKSNAPYILHALAVMHAVEHHGTDYAIVGVLHDAVEDFVGTPQERLLLVDEIEQAFGQRVSDALAAMTRRPGEDYAAYLERVADNVVARRVKIADLTHNMDPRRIPANEITDMDYHRWNKYRKALIRLERH